MDIGKAFSYVFEDPDWLTKVLVGSLILLTSLALAPFLIGFVGFMLVTGYSLEVLLNVRQGRSRPLPPWQEKWGEWIVWGLKLWVVVLVWSLPLVLALIPGVAGGALSENSEVAGSLLLTLFCCLLFLWTLILVFVSPALYIRMAETKEISSGFHFGEIFRFTLANIGAIAITMIVLIVASLIFSLAGWILGLLLCFVGLMITVPASWLLTMLVESHLFAQIGLDSVAQPAPMSETVAPAAVDDSDGMVIIGESVESDDDGDA